MDKIFPDIPNDKRLHIACGFCIALSSYFIGIWGLILAMLAGVGKEIYDYFDYGKPDILDFAATLLGGVVGWAAVQLLGAL